MSHRGEQGARPMRKFNCKGPEAEPWGTPARAASHEENEESIRTRCRQSVRQAAITSREHVRQCQGGAMHLTVLRAKPDQRLSGCRSSKTTRTCFRLGLPRLSALGWRAAKECCPVCENQIECPGETGKGVCGESRRLVFQEGVREHKAEK